MTDIITPSKRTVLKNKRESTKDDEQHEEKKPKTRVSLLRQKNYGHHSRLYSLTVPFKGNAHSFFMTAKKCKDCGYGECFMKELFVSSKISGVKDLHVCFFKTGTGVSDVELWNLIATYKLPHLQTWLFEGSFYHASLGPVSGSRYAKILKAAQSKSWDEFKKRGHVLFPMKATFCVVKQNLPLAALSRPHLNAFGKMRNNPAGWFSPEKLVGKGKPRLYGRNHGD